MLDIFNACLLVQPVLTGHETNEVLIMIYMLSRTN